MSKYDDFLTIKAKTEKLIKDFTNQLYEPKGRDKTGLHFRFEEIKPGGGHFSCIILSTDMRHGYYGDSSCSDDASVEAGAELATTLNALKDRIIQITIDRLEKTLIKAAQAAKEEAEQIIELASTGD